MKGDKNTEIYQCAHCGKDYTPRRRHSQKYCSSSCNVAACRKRNGYIYNPRYVPPDKPVAEGVLPIIAQGVASSPSTVRNIAESTAGSLLAQAVVKGVEYFVDTKEVTLLRKIQNQVLDLQQSADQRKLIDQIYGGLNELMVMMIENTQKIVHSQDKLNNKVDLLISREDEVIWEKELTNKNGNIYLYKIYNHLTGEHRYEDGEGRLFIYEIRNGKGNYRPAAKRVAQGSKSA